MTPLRHLVLVLGDQLNRDSSAFDGFDAAQDALWMAEVAEESTHVPSSQIRTVLFLSAMRHFAADRRAEGLPLHYTTLGDGQATLVDALAAELRRHPAGCVLTCSALKRRYRERLRAAAPGLRFVFMAIGREDAERRVAARARP